MRLSIVSFGSEGDTRPLAVLSRGLLDRGHTVKLFADDATLGLARSLGVPCERLSGDVKASLPIVHPSQKLRISDIIKTGKALKEIVSTNMASWLRVVGHDAQQADAVLCSSLALGVGLTLREELKKPLIGLWFQPITPTGEYSSPMLPPMKLPRFANRLTFRLLKRQIGSFAEVGTRGARHELYGRKEKLDFNFDFPILYGISPSLVRQPSDWPADHLLCGHWSRAMDDWTPPDDLANFLAAGEPPIYVGFGSPSSFVRSKALSAITQAVGSRRAIFSPGWSLIDSSVLPPNFFIVRDVPHEWLFPSVSVAIHHGGAGTTHTAARAGIPQVILPFGADHHYWGDRIAVRGAGPKASRNARLDGAKLSALLAASLRPEFKKGARDLAKAMAREDGVSVAVKHIERIVHTS